MAPGCRTESDAAVDLVSDPWTNEIADARALDKWRTPPRTLGQMESATTGPWTNEIATADPWTNEIIRPRAPGQMACDFKGFLSGSWWFQWIRSSLGSLGKIPMGSREAVTGESAV